MREHFPNLGFGLGLRPKHYPHIFEHSPAVDWFEIISENFMDTGGRPRRNLDRIRADYPIVMHGVALSIGTVDPLNSTYLRQLKQLMDDIEPAWVSDHLCWTGVAHKTLHDLLPVPYTEEALRHIVQRILAVQDYLGRPIALENPSTYLEFSGSTIAEAQFIAEMAQRSGCQLLLDVNNVYVTCFNHRLDAKAYIDALPLNRVVQVHLAGHCHNGTHIIDTHDNFVVDEVWDLYRYATAKAGRTFNTMIEWDDDIPEFEVLYGEMSKAKRIAAELLTPLFAKTFSAPAASVPAQATVALALSQQQLQQAITSTQAPNSALWIKEKADFPALAQLGVYRNAYRFRLFDSVAEDYPVLRRVLGDALFDACLHQFIEAITPAHYNIARYSEEFPAYVGQFYPDQHFAHEVAQLENVLTQLADAPETVALQPADLAHLTPELLMQMVLAPRAALRLVAFTYPVNAYYTQVMEDQDVAVPTSAASKLAVFRHEDVVWRMELEAAEYALLEQLFAGLPVGQALAVIEQQSLMPAEELAEKLSEWFARWMRNGLLANNQMTSQGENDVQVRYA